MSEWQPWSTAPTRKGIHVLVNDKRHGVGEAILFDSGTWGLATFNGQIIEARPTHWMHMPAPPPKERDPFTGLDAIGEIARLCSISLPSTEGIK